MTTPLTGDIKNYEAKEKFGVTFQNFPVVPYSELQAKGSTVNDFAQSGKRLGAQLMAVDSIEAPTKATIMVAAGSGSTSKWIAIKDVISTQTDVTPA